MKKKLKLGNLEVNSFVTSMDQKEKQTVKGGARTLKECISYNMTMCGSCGIGCTYNATCTTNG